LQWSHHPDIQVFAAWAIFILVWNRLEVLNYCGFLFPLTFKELKGRNTGAEVKAKKSLLAQGKSKGGSERKTAGPRNL
jgi:hypothetical protein